MNNKIIRVFGNLFVFFTTITIMFKIMLVGDNEISLFNTILFPPVLYCTFLFSILLHEFGHYLYAKNQGYKLLKMRITHFRGASLVMNYHEGISDQNSYIKVIADLKNMLLMGPLVTLIIFITAFLIFLTGKYSLVMGSLVIINISILIRSLYSSGEHDIQDIYTYLNFEQSKNKIDFALITQSICEENANSFLLLKLMKRLEVKLMNRKILKEHEVLYLIIIIAFEYENKTLERGEDLIELLNRDYYHCLDVKNLFSYVCICALICINIEKDNKKDAMEMYEIIDEEENIKWVVSHTAYRFFYEEVLYHINGEVPNNREKNKVRFYRKIGLIY